MQDQAQLLKEYIKKRQQSESEPKEEKVKKQKCAKILSVTFRSYSPIRAKPQTGSRNTRKGKKPPARRFRTSTAQTTNGAAEPKRGGA